ncbi:MAG: stalk domain-containing protein [Clostridia bacterium]|nr:stalk domain-containing protein [Clostridia bacterium]
MKKAVSIFLIAAILISCTSAFAFEFPSVDWGALLSEKERMVTETEFELYTAGDISNLPYYGARLEPKDGAYLGMIAETSEKFWPVGCYLTYIDAMNQPDLYYPANEIIKGNDSAVMVGWTINSLDEVNYDTIRSVLNTLASYNKPMYIRFGNEMNVSSLGDDPIRYVEVFRNVANMVHEYDNFAVVWSPNDLGALDRPFEYFYPGDEYVDWIGVSMYMIKYFQGKPDTSYKDSVYFMTGDYAWATNRIKPIVEFMAKNNINKPVMISEGGVPTNTNHDTDLSVWGSPRMRNMLWYLVMKYPQIKMINYFNNHRANEAERYDINDYNYASDIFSEAKTSGLYKTSVGASSDFCFVKAENGEIINIDANPRLYTLAYFPNNPDITVNYAIDGEWCHSSDTIPYILNFGNIPTVSDGRHTLKIWAADREKEYVFYKHGSQIRFGEDFEGANNSEIKVIIDGETLATDQPPVIINDRTLVPLRAIFEKLGAFVDWNELAQSVTATKDGREISLAIGGNTMYVNGEEKPLDVPAMIYGERTLVPVRAVSEALSCNVEWIGEENTVVIKTK